MKPDELDIHIRLKYYANNKYKSSNRGNNNGCVFLGQETIALIETFRLARAAG